MKKVITNAEKDVLVLSDVFVNETKTSTKRSRKLFIKNETGTWMM